MAKLHPPVSDHDQQTGNPRAAVILVEYGDFQCPECGQAYPLIKKLLDEESDHFRFVFRNFPLQESHPAAYMAALAAEAAGQQGKFWPMHNMIFENQDNLHGNSFIDFSIALKLDLHRFAADWKSEPVKQKVEADFESGLRSGVNGTPTFFVNETRLPYDGTYQSLLNAIAVV